MQSPPQFFNRTGNPQSRVLVDHHDALCQEFLALDYSYLDDDKPAS